MLSIGDLAQSYLVKTNQTRIKSEMQRLSKELTTGVKDDIPEHLSGDLNSLAAMERSLNTLQSFQLVTTEATMISATMQRILEDAQTVTSDLSVSLLRADLAVTEEARAAMGTEARATIEKLTSGFNGAFAGRALFSGTATDAQAVTDADTLLADLRTALAGATTAADIRAGLDAWFDAPGGGFETSTYTGATENRSPVQLSDTTSVDLSLRADDPVFRNLLKFAAMAELATDPTIGLSMGDQTELVLEAGEGLLSDQAQLTSLRGNLGAVEQRIEETVIRNRAESIAIEMARSALVSADPYDAATELESVQFQLESLYAVTARTSRLSLANYL